jgi:hypothetical protein
MSRCSVPIVPKKADRDGHRHHELGSIHAADRLANLAASSEQRRGCQRSPTAAAYRIQDARNEAEGWYPLGRELTRALARSTPQDQPAKRQQVQRHHGANQFAGKRGQHISAEHPAHDTGNRQTQKQAAINVVHHQVGGARHPGGDHFRRVHAGTDDGGAVVRWSPECWKTAVRRPSRAHRRPTGRAAPPQQTRRTRYSVPSKKARRTGASSMPARTLKIQSTGVPRRARSIDLAAQCDGDLFSIRQLPPSTTSTSPVM